MYRLIDFSQAGGLYLYQDSLDFLQQAYSAVLDAAATFYGNKIILSGVTVAGGDVSDGWVVVDGEILPFQGGAITTYAYVSEDDSNEQFNDGTAKSIYKVKTVKLSVLSTDDTFLFTDLVRLPFCTDTTPTLKDALSTIQTFFKNLINFENCVILAGCAVSAVDTIGSTCTISAGTVMINGNIVAAPLRAAATYPCWLKPDGTYVTADPGGDNIKFAPNTSQYYADVLRRKTHTSGMIVMSSSATDLAMFDLATGLGKDKWLGWKICDLVQSRVPVGYDRRAADPVDGIWNANYHTLAYKDAALTNARAIEQTNLPHVRIDVTGLRGNSYTGTPTSPDISGSGDAESGTHTVGQTDYLGDGTAMDLRQSFGVILYIERL